MELKTKWGDQFVSVEHLVLAMAEDPRFGAQLFKQEGLTKDKLEEAIKEVSGLLAGWLCAAWLLGMIPAWQDVPLTMHYSSYCCGYVLV